MKRLRARNVFESNRFCYLFSRIINFEFVTIERKIDGTIKGFTTKWDVLRFIAGFLFGFLMFYDLISTSLQLQKRSIIFEITMSFLGKMQGLYCLLVMLQVFIYRYEYLRIFVILDWIDRKLLLFGIHRDHEKDSKFFSIFLVFYEIVILSNFLFSYFMVTVLNVKMETIPIDRGFYLISLFITINYVTIAMLMQMAASWRLQDINEALIMTAAKSDRNKVLRKMKILMKMWGKIEDLINSLNNYHTMNNILSFLNFFMIFLMISFLGYDILAHNLGSEDTIFFCAGISFSFWSGLNCVITIIYSMSFNNIMKNSNRGFSHISIECNDRKIKKFCHIANLQLSSSQSELSCGLFGFNWKLIFTIIAAFFSYLLVMVQFDYMITIQSMENLKISQSF